MSKVCPASGNNCGKEQAMVVFGLAGLKASSSPWSPGPFLFCFTLTVPDLGFWVFGLVWFFFQSLSDVFLSASTIHSHPVTCIAVTILCLFPVHVAVTCCPLCWIPRAVVLPNPGSRAPLQSLCSSSLVAVEAALPRAPRHQCSG